MATFSVNDQARRAQSTGNGSATDFSFSFQVNATSDVKVYVGDTLKTLSTHYTIVDSSAAAGLNTDGTGVVKFITSPTDYTPANGDVVTILSDVPVARTSVYTSGGNITAAALESDFDTITMQVADREERDGRQLTAPVSDPSNIDMTLPAKASRLGKVLGFNSSTGNPEATQQVTDASVSVSSLSAGASPTASVSVSSGTAAFALGIPTGATGATGSTGATGAAGAAASISVGSVTANTVSTGGSATAAVSNAGSSSAATFNFTFGIPVGATGATGAQGPAGDGDLISTNNLSDVANAGTARSNLGLGTAAVAATGISSGNVAVFTSGAADNDFLRIDGTSIEGRSASEVLSDIGGTTATAAADEATALAIALG